MPYGNIDQLSINTLRFLAVDAVQKAGNGHPGAPMGASPMAYVLWDRFLKHNPTNPSWPDRDRFVLSAGHASILLYGLLHLTGYDLSLDEIKNLRQWGSKTPGHPEYGHTSGVEVTTGPLGQGFANGVGMAIAEQWMGNHYNRVGHEVINHYTYAIVSDGDLQEGVASEAASLAGTLGLGKLIYLYDDNDISIEGNTDIAFTEDVAARFRAYGWHVVDSIDGMDTGAVDAAIRQAQAETARPSIVICRTIIGYGSPNKAGTGGVHGAALGVEEVQLTKDALGWSYPDDFAEPQEALDHYRQAIPRGQAQQKEWEASFASYRDAYPDDARKLKQAWAGELSEGWSNDADGLFNPGDKPVSTREASGKTLNAMVGHVHGLVGGSADLAPSNNTRLSEAGDFSATNRSGQNMHFGVREHAMGSIANGMALHGGIVPYTATFLIFSDYMRPPMRLAALMGLRVVFIFTHDSVGLGEDGPTHQPIEQLAGLRAVPNLVVLRPADATETVEAWKAAIERKDGPTVLAFSRQNLPVLDRSTLAPASSVRQGGYILWESSSTPDVIIISTGSEVHIAMDAAQQLSEGGTAVRVVSLPSWELFDGQSQEYKDSVLPPNITARVSIEAGSQMGWERYVGLKGRIIGLSHFGASAPIATLYEKFGLTAERVVEEAKAALQQVKV
ncbi:MAG: transketolase [SAR202 cluster bacterium]|nr:transketolase [SAR202 cluster bacterium]